MIPSSIPPVRLGIMPLPRLPPARGGLVELMPLAQTAALLARGRQAARLAVLMDRLDDPVDARVASDGLVLRVHQDALKVLVRAVLVDPVGVEDAEVGASSAAALLGCRFQRSLVLQLVDTLVRGLAWCCGGLRDPCVSLGTTRSGEDQRRRRGGREIEGE